MASTSPTKTRTAPKSRSQGDGRKPALPGYRLQLIDPKQITASKLCGISIFGNCLPYLGEPIDIDDPVTAKMFRATDRILKKNAKLVGAFEHREQLGWVFRKLVQTADALGVSVSSEKALKALHARLRHDATADAMLTLVWISTLIERAPEQNERLQRDTLREAVARARALNAGGKYESPRDKRRRARLSKLLRTNSLEAA